MAFFLTQLPWILVWLVVLVLQERYIRKKNWLGSVLLIWISLVVSFVWNPVVDLLFQDNAAALQFGSRFWLLAILTAILHFLGKQRDKMSQKMADTQKAAQEAAQSSPETTAEPESMETETEPETQEAPDIRDTQNTQSTPEAADEPKA